MEIKLTKVGSFGRQCNTAQQNAINLLAEPIKAIAMKFDGQGNSGSGLILIVRACYCCDQQHFNHNRDVPDGTTHIVCAFPGTDTQEIEYDRQRKRIREVYRMKREIPHFKPEISSMPSFSDILRGPKKLTLEDLVAEEMTHYLADFQALLTQVTGFPAN